MEYMVKPTRQQHMSMRFMAIWMMLITGVLWMMLDMYLPALPVITEEFGVSESYLNITLTVGMVTCAIGTFFGGTLSDRFGRKGPFLLGMAAASLGCFLAMFAKDVPTLTLTRGFAVAGSGVVQAVSVAIIRDSYEEEEFNRVTSYLQAIAVIGPLVAPSLGALLINFASWRYIFLFLGLTTLIMTIPMLRLTETWPKERRIVGNMKTVWDQSIAFIQNRAFLTFMLLVACATIPLWAYIGVSSYVFINEFGLSNTAYGIYYAIGAVASLLGPFIYMGMCKITVLRRIMHFCLIILAGAAVFLLLAGRISPVMFLLGSIPVLIVEGIARPLSVVAVLEEHASEAGTASSWMQFIMNLIGVVGTTLATLQWTSMVIGVGVITAGSVVVGTAAWIVLLRGHMMKVFE